MRIKEIIIINDGNNNNNNNNNDNNKVLKQRKFAPNQGFYGLGCLSGKILDPTQAQQMGNDKRPTMVPYLKLAFVLYIEI